MPTPSRHRLPALGAALLVALAVAVLVRAAPTPAASAPTTAVTGCAYAPSPTQVRRGPSTAKRVALTFDDGPAALTSSVLRVLAQERVPATFFVVGRNVAGREALLRRALAAGHMLANHSFTHVSLAKADAAATQELKDTQDAIARATGFTPCLFRPPFGASSRALVTKAGDQRLTSVLWSVNSKDFTEPGTAAIRQRVLADVRPGSIVLLHDGGGDRRQTLAALPSIVRTLKARGYRFVTVPSLLGLSLTHASRR